MKAKAWLYWIVIVGPVLALCLEVKDKETVRYDRGLGYSTVSFTTVYATKGSYTRFLMSLRNHLRKDVKEDIPRLAEKVRVSERFLYVGLSASGGISITLAIDVINLYVVGYKANNGFYYLSDAPVPECSNLFPEARVRQNLSFSGNYDDLEKYAGHRDKVDLGINELAQAVRSFYNNEKRPSLARSFIVCIQMISEAARFRYIEGRVRDQIDDSGEPPVYHPFKPDGAMLSYEQNWKALSKAVQNSNQGSFSKVELQDAYYQTYSVDRVSDLMSNLVLMLYVCEKKVFESSLIIRSVADDDIACAIPEPTIRIRGRGGLCVQVRNGQYGNGNPIELSPCKSNSGVKQLWTLKKDGTIRSNGKCMAAPSSGSGSSVVIYDCSATAAAAIHWEVSNDGTIRNSQSKLVLSAQSGSSGTALTVQTNIYAASQGWLPTANSEPFIRSIVAYNSYCVATNGNNVGLLKCDSGKKEQKWAMYADGTIRPQQKQENCLTCTGTNGCLRGTRVAILSCSPASSNQRWLFASDGTILNLFSRLVMDADASQKQITVRDNTGEASQSWFTMF